MIMPGSVPGTGSLKGPPVFICGCGHSGTSLLAAMFAAHPDVFVPQRETEVFLDESLAPARLSDLLLEAEATGKPYLVEKTPRHVRAMALIRSLVPDARFIVMVRDGRDVVASFLKRHGDLETGLARWIADNSIVAQESGRSDVFVLRYEDLIESPGESLRRVTGFCGIPYSDAMLRYHEAPKLWFGQSEIRQGTGKDGAEHNALRNWQINQPIFDGRGKWQGLVPEDLLRKGAAAPLMRRFGYLPPESAAGDAAVPQATVASRGDSRASGPGEKPPGKLRFY